MLQKTKFSSRLITIIVDEVHYLKLWSPFRNDYWGLGRLWFILPIRVHFALVSATLPRPVLAPVFTHLGITSSELYAVRLSNDRNNIALVVRKIQYPANGFQDLNFLVPGMTDSDTSGGSQRSWHKKLVIFDSEAEATSAGNCLMYPHGIDLKDIELDGRI